MERQLQQATRSAEAALASVKDLQARVEAQTGEAQAAAAHMRELRTQLEARSQVQGNKPCLCSSAWECGLIQALLLLSNGVRC